MNKSELIDAVATETGLNKTQAERAVTATLGKISSTLASAEDVALAGFGTFTAKIRPARTGRNPRTGEHLEIAASTTVAFKPGKALKEALN